MGSPPPTRGTPIAVPAVVVKPGITPAYAGNTKSPFLISASHRDHPRLRGEHTDKFKKNFPRLGSPPPTRGTHIENDVKGLYEGITPAYAGNTFTNTSRPYPFGDHPRLRGEHQKSRKILDIKRGSPPPTRGTLIVYLNTYFTFRITPAYAGNT